MALEPIGDIADVSLTESTGATADKSTAQMLARRGHPTERVERESNVSRSVAQVYVRREGNSR